MIRRDRLGSLLFILLLAAGFIGLRAWTGRTAPVPEVFDRTLTLAAAQSRASADKKIVLAFATADWCAPCQSFKRGALQDPQVTTWLATHAVPVYVDVTGPSEEGASLGVRAVPAMILLENGREIARLEGAVGPTELLGWLRSHTPAQ